VIEARGREMTAGRIAINTEELMVDVGAYLDMLMSAISSSIWPLSLFVLLSLLLSLHAVV